MESESDDDERMGPAGGSDRRVGRRGRSRHRVLALQDEVLGTPYLEKVSFKPFGPVDNGNQHLYGLDYKTAMWRGDEENPFHTEVGYWLWDAATGEVLRGFVVPRGITVLAGRHRRGRRHHVHPARRAGRPAVHHRREPLPGRARQHAQLRGHDHGQRRRLLVLRRDHDAPDERARPSPSPTPTTTRCAAPADARRSRRTRPTPRSVTSRRGTLARGDGVATRVVLDG